MDTNVQQQNADVSKNTLLLEQAEIAYKLEMMKPPRATARQAEDTRKVQKRGQLRKEKQKKKTKTKTIIMKRLSPAGSAEVDAGVTRELGGGAGVTGAGVELQLADFPEEESEDEEEEEDEDDEEEEQEEKEGEGSQGASGRTEPPDETETACGGRPASGANKKNCLRRSFAPNCGIRLKFQVQYVLQGRKKYLRTKVPKI